MSYRKLKIKYMHTSIHEFTNPTAYQYDNIFSDKGVIFLFKFTRTEKIDLNYKMGVD